MPVTSATIQKIDAKFLKLDRQFHSNLVAGTTPDCEREFAELRKAIQDARLEDANEPPLVRHSKPNPTAHEHNPGGRVVEIDPATGDPVKVVTPAPVTEVKPPFFPGAIHPANTVVEPVKVDNVLVKE